MTQFSQNNIENAYRSKRAFIVIAILAVIICAVQLVGVIRELRSVNEARKSLSISSGDLDRITRQLPDMRRLAVAGRASSGGLDLFATTLSESAKSLGVSITALLPEGSPSASDIVVSDTKLGTWNATRLRVKGMAPFTNAMAFLDTFRGLMEPVRIDCYTVESNDTGHGEVSFELVLTVYEKRNGAS